MYLPWLKASLSEHTRRPLAARDQFSLPKRVPLTYHRAMEETIAVKIVVVCAVLAAGALYYYLYR